LTYLQYAAGCLSGCDIVCFVLSCTGEDGFNAVVTDSVERSVPGSCWRWWV